MALAAYPERTIVVEAGHLTPIADLAGINAICFDGSSTSVKKLIARLKMTGCLVDDRLGMDRYSDLVIGRDR